MLRFLADENFNGRIIRGLLLRRPDLDLVRVQDEGLSGASDPAVLEWAAGEGRLLLTHDLRTVPQYAYQRVQSDEPMPGVFICDPLLSFQQVIADILLLNDCSREAEWEGQVRYLPL